MPSLKPSIHYGWFIVPTGTLCIFAALGVGRFSLGMLLPATGQGLGLTVSQMGFLGTANFVGYLVSQHNSPLYLGEFGAYDKGDMASRVRWTSFVARSAEKLGWSWAYWQFDGDFIVYDMKEQKWVESLRDALIPRVN